MRQTTFFPQLLTFANDWRDSLFYSILLILYVFCWVWQVHIGSGLFLILGALREAIRAFAWFYAPSRNAIYACMAVVACELLALLRIAILLFKYMHVPSTLASQCPFLLLHLTVCATALSYAGGFKSIYRKYRDLLFDFPRKDKPPVQRRPSEAVRKLKKLISQLTPRPAPIPQI